MSFSSVLTGVVLASASLLACATSHVPAAASTTLSSGTPNTTGDSCRGAQFDADDPDPRCLRGRATADAPAVKDLKISLHADSVAKAGHEAVLVLEMRNVSGAPMVLDVDPACSFGAVAKSGDVTSMESDCGGICGRTSSEPGVLHVTLEPDGVVVKRVHFYATQVRETMKDAEHCEQHSAGALPPGRYQLNVTLPWADPSPANPSTLVARSVEVPITVTP